MNNNNKKNNNNISIISKNTDDCKTNDKNENTNSYIINENEEMKKSLFNFYYPIKNKNLVWKSKIKHNHSLHIDLTGLSTSQITDSEFKREMENRLKEKEIEEKLKLFKIKGGLYKNAFNNYNHFHNKHKLSLLNDYSSNTNNITNSIIENNNNNNYNNNNKNCNNVNNVNDNNDNHNIKKNDEKLLKIKIKKHKKILNIPPIKIKKKPNIRTISMDLTMAKTSKKNINDEKKNNNNNNSNKTVIHKKNKNINKNDEFDNKCQCCKIF